MTPRPVKIEHARYIDREDHAHRSSVEEATVEIVRKPLPAINGAAQVAAASAAALEASLDAALEAGRHVQADAKKAETAKSPTPIGRFLKALTGN